MFVLITIPNNHYTVMNLRNTPKLNIYFIESVKTLFYWQLRKTIAFCINNEGYVETRDQLNIFIYSITL